MARDLPYAHGFAPVVGPTSLSRSSRQEVQSADSASTANARIARCSAARRGWTHQRTPHGGAGHCRALGVTEAKAAFRAEYEAWCTDPPLEATGRDEVVGHGSSSLNRSTPGAAGFLILSQAAVRGERLDGAADIERTLAASVSDIAQTPRRPKVQATID
jgi:hypothetical protein